MPKQQKMPFINCDKLRLFFFVVNAAVELKSKILFQAIAALVRIDMSQFPGLYGSLGLLPEINAEKIGVVRHENLTQRFGQSQEFAEFFRKDIVFVHIKPRFGGQFIIVA